MDSEHLEKSHNWDEDNDRILSGQVDFTARIPREEKKFRKPHTISVSKPCKEPGCEAKALGAKKYCLDHQLDNSNRHKNTKKYDLQRYSHDHTTK